MNAVRVLDIDADGYQRHPLHGPDMPWQETNCYVDIWIELIHAFGFEVEPALGFTLAMDFEQDQWTFFKPGFQHLERLYGLRTEELALWRSLPEQCTTQVANGNLPLLEVDSFFLPDTSATDYRRNHVKTTIGINEIDQEARRLGYLHNAGYHALEGEDFDGLFRLDRESPADFLPPYCDVVKTGYLKSESPTTELILELLRQNAASRPISNPFTRYRAAFESHLDWIRDMDSYHAYVFATLRQCGAAFYLASRHLSWLAGKVTATEPNDWISAAEHFEHISSGCKTLLLKLARVANGKSPRNLSAAIVSMEAAWTTGFAHIDKALAAV